MTTCIRNVLSCVCIYDIIPSFTADPAVFISNDVEYVLDGNSVSIEAGIFSSATPVVEWFLDGVLLNIDNDPQLNQVTADTLFTLNVANISSEYVGIYTVEVTHNGQTTSDSINVTYASESHNLFSVWYF